MTSKAKVKINTQIFDPRTMIICRNLVSYCYLVDVVAFSYSLYFLRVFFPNCILYCLIDKIVSLLSHTRLLHYKQGPIKLRAHAHIRSPYDFKFYVPQFNFWRCLFVVCYAFCVNDSVFITKSVNLHCQINFNIATNDARRRSTNNNNDTLPSDHANVT